jgi:hypothetical protein
MTEQEIAALQAERDQLRSSIQGLSAERDQYRQQLRDAQGQGANASPQAAAGRFNTHPLAQFVGVEADYSPIDQYYDGRYVNPTQLQQWAKAVHQQALDDARANFFLFRNIDRTVTSKEYADEQAPWGPLGKYDSPLAKKTQEILQKQYNAKPLDGADSWEKWQYGDINDFSTAARVARAEMILEQQQQAAAAAASQGKQDAAAVVSGAGVASGGTSTGKITTTEEAFAAVDRGDTKALDAALTT